MKTTDDTNPVICAAKLHKPFHIFHTHVIDRAILDAAVASRKSLEVDISITPEGSIYVGHPLLHYRVNNLPSPNNLPLEVIVKEAKAAGLFLVLDLKDVKTISTAREVIDGYGAENCLVHAFAQELSFQPWPPKVKTIMEPSWVGEELPLDKLLALRAAIGVPLALSCHGITQERLSDEGDSILQQIIEVAEQGVLAVSLSMPPDEETPLDFANKLITSGVVPLIRFDDTAVSNRPDYFLGFTDHLERATDPKG